METKFCFRPAVHRGDLRPQLCSLCRVGGFAEAAPGKITQGALRIVSQDGQANSQCLLKHTAVKAEISGSLALDMSGSMNGFPIEKAKEARKLAIDGMNPLDTFNLITFGFSELRGAGNRS